MFTAYTATISTVNLTTVDYFLKKNYILLSV